MRRDQVVNTVLSLFADPDYLEVGVSTGETFFAVEARRKVAVDPVFAFDISAASQREPHSQFHQTTSDDYFSQSTPSTLFDVIYLDGLHTADQILRDLLNAIVLLKPKGVIIIDDVMPNSYHASLADLNAAMYMRTKLYPDTADHSWMGDVYKVIYFINSFMQQYSYAMVADNHGQLVVWKEPRRIEHPQPITEAVVTSFEKLLMDEFTPNRKPMQEIMGLLQARR